MEFGLSLTPASLRAPDGGVDSSKMNALVLQVKELLPDLGEDFIQVTFTFLFTRSYAFYLIICFLFVKVCLKHYDYNPEAVINAILEDNLPPHLNERQIPDILPTPETFSFEEPADVSKKNRTK